MYKRQELVLTGGNVNDAINEGVRRGYKNGYLRKSIVKDPIFDRTNTQDNKMCIRDRIYVPAGMKDHVYIR